jgi:hypothetical protein
MLLPGLQTSNFFVELAYFVEEGSARGFEHFFLGSTSSFSALGGDDQTLNEGYSDIEVKLLVFKGGKRGAWRYCVGVKERGVPCWDPV